MHRISIMILSALFNPTTREPKNSEASKGYSPTEPKRTRFKRMLKAQPHTHSQGGMAQTNRNSPTAHIPQRVTARTGRAGRRGTHKPHGRGGAGAGEPPHPPTIGGGTGAGPRNSARSTMRRGYGWYICHSPVADKKCPNLSPLFASAVFLNHRDRREQ